MGKFDFCRRLGMMACQFREGNEPIEHYQKNKLSSKAFEGWWQSRQHVNLSSISAITHVDRMTLRCNGVKLANGIIGSRPFVATCFSMRRLFPGTDNYTAPVITALPVRRSPQRAGSNTSINTSRSLLILDRRSSFSKIKSAPPFSAKDTSDRNAFRPWQSRPIVPTECCGADRADLRRRPNDLPGAFIVFARCPCWFP